MNDLQRVLNDLETRRTLPVSAEVQKLDHAARDAARLLRELAADFDGYAIHGSHSIPGRPDVGCQKDWQPIIRECGCGLDAARAKWRLE